MPISFNGSTVSTVYFNGTTVSTVYFNNELVFFNEITYYSNGVQNVPWSAGYSIGSIGYILFSQNPPLMYLEAGSSGNVSVNERATTTTNTVDLTYINTLYIDWEGLRSTSSIGQSANFIVSTSSTASFTTFNARTQVIFSNVAGDRRTSSLDVSGLTGNYFIRIHARDGSSTSDRWNNIRVYRVWGTV
jgi:hypothetical protein